MALITCPECSKSVSDRADQCPHCGYSMAVRRQGDVSKGVCPTCLQKMKRVSTSPGEGAGCIVIILGLVLSPILIGIPIAIYGIMLMSKKDHFWQCQTCGARFHYLPTPRPKTQPVKQVPQTRVEKGLQIALVVLSIAAFVIVMLILNERYPGFYR